MIFYPGEVDWSEFPDIVVAAAAADGIPGAMAEVERRLGDDTPESVDSQHAH